jgi:hypothetical protein
MKSTIDAGKSSNTCTIQISPNIRICQKIILLVSKQEHCFFLTSLEDSWLMIVRFTTTYVISTYHH